MDPGIYFMKSFLLLAAFLYFNTGFAQPFAASWPVKAIRTFNSKTAEKGTGTSSRLIAQGGFRGYNARRVDSSVFTYSNGRSGDLNHPPQFDSKTNYFMWDTAQQAFAYIQRQLNTYDAANRVDTQLSQQDIGGSFADAYRTRYFYDALGRDTAESIESFSNVWTLIEHTCNVYDNNNRIISQTNQSFQPMQANYPRRLTWTYNAAGRLTSLVAESLINGMWIPESGNEFYTYDATNRLVQDDVYHYGGGSTPTNGIRTTYYYTGTDTIYQSAVQSYYPGNGAPYVAGDSAVVTAKDPTGNIQTIIHYTSNGGGLYARETFTYTPTSLTASYSLEGNSSTTGTWTPGAQAMYSYNNYNQLTHVYSRFWDGSNWVSGIHDSDFRYYYEEYQSNLGVPSHTAANNSLKVWPVPAQRTVMLQFSPLKPGVYTAELSDIAGRKMMSWQGTARAVEEQSMDVSQYPPGAYMLRIRCGDEVMTRSFTVRH